MQRTKEVQRIHLVNHPIRIASILRAAALEKDHGNTKIESNVPCGPLGLRMYTIITDNTEIANELLKMAAWKYKIVILTDVIHNYSLDHFLKMFGAFLEKTIGAKPDGFEVMRFADPKTTHVYPVYRDDYLYISEEEEKLIQLDSLSIVGLYPLFIERDCWNYMRINRPIAWGESAIVRSSDAYSSLEDAEDTKRLMNHVTRMLQRDDKHDNPARSSRYFR